MFPQRLATTLNQAELKKLRASHGDALGDLERELAATKATLAQRGEELGPRSPLLPSSTP